MRNKSRDPARSPEAQLKGPGDFQELRLLLIREAACTTWSETPSRTLIIVYRVRMFAVPLLMTPRKRRSCVRGFPGSSYLPGHGGGGFFGGCCAYR